MAIRITNQETKDSNYNEKSYYFAVFNLIECIVFMSKTEIYVTGMDAVNIEENSGNLILLKEIGEHNKLFEKFN